MSRIPRFSPVAGLAAVAVLAGCATPPPPMPKYQPPTSGPTAKLVMRGAVQPGDLYGVFIYADSERCTNPSIVGVGDANRNPVTTELPAGRMTTVEFIVRKPDKQMCGLRWTLTPAAGKTYLLRGTSSATNCLALVHDMTDPDNMKLEPTSLRRTANGQSCVPLSQAKGPAGLDAGKSAEAELKPGATATDLQGLMGR